MTLFTLPEQKLISEFADLHPALQDLSGVAATFIETAYKAHLACQNTEEIIRRISCRPWLSAAATARTNREDLANLQANIAREVFEFVSIYLHWLSARRQALRSSQLLRESISALHSTHVGPGKESQNQSLLMVIEACTYTANNLLKSNAEWSCLSTLGHTTLLRFAAKLFCSNHWDQVTMPKKLDLLFAEGIIESNNLSCLRLVEVGEMTCGIADRTKRLFETTACSRQIEEHQIQQSWSLIDTLLKSKDYPHSHNNDPCRELDTQKAQRLLNNCRLQILRQSVREWERHIQELASMTELARLETSEALKRAPNMNSVDIPELQQLLLMLHNCRAAELLAKSHKIEIGQIKQYLNHQEDDLMLRQEVKRSVKDSRS